MRRWSPPKDTHILPSLSAPRIGALAFELGARRRLRRGEMLFSAGDAVRHLFIVESGRLAIGNAAGVLAELGAGETLLLECGGVRALDCEAEDATTVLALERRLVDRWSAADPELAAEIARLHAAELKLMLAAISSSLAAAGAQPAHAAGFSRNLVEEGVDDVHLTVDVPDRRCGWPSGAETGKPSSPRSGILPFRRGEGQCHG